MERKLHVACIGGGQLGRMMALEGPRLNIAMTFLDPNGSSCPAGQVVGPSAVIQGALTDATAIRALIGMDNKYRDEQDSNQQDRHWSCDVLTVEIEHVGVDVLAALEREGVNVQPSSRVLSIVRDKFLQKEHFAAHNIPLPPFFKTSTISEIKQAGRVLGLPIMLKARKGGYDGRGNAILESLEDDDIHKALQKLGIGTNPDDLDLYAEGWIEFSCEIAVMVVRSSNGQDSFTYPAVNAIQQDSICRIVLAPAINLPLKLRQKCQDLAQQAVDSLGTGASGMFGVELFLCSDGRVLLNEVAPRPHNTGHYTQDACTVSQFENHLRGICGLPLGSTKMIVEAAAMVNVLGAKSGSIDDTMKSSHAAFAMPRAVVHWYGKTGCNPGRKVGHINLTGDSHAELQTHLKELLVLEGIPLSLLNFTGTTSSTSPLVGVIMGSQSDLPTMQAAVEVLRKFSIPHEVDIVSAHRTPDKLVDYARGAAGRGIRVIIAGAGGAAHLPGMVASMTPLPVIGVPVKTSTLSGVDSLYSIVQMPRGIPVATVAIGNAENAGLLAVRMLSTSRVELRQKMMEYQEDLTNMVNKASEALEALGSDAYLMQMDSKNQVVNV